jgi:Co/Zn/Cd efflux system component
VRGTGLDLRATVLLVAGLNLAYFVVEFGVALTIGSVSLSADSIDFLEDASVNTLIFLGMGWGAASRARLGRVLALILLVPSLWALWIAWQKLTLPVAPEALPLSLTALGALAVNLGCALLLARHRSGRGSLTRAAFLSARNDAVANVAIIAAGLVTAAFPTAWPDLIVGLGVAILNARAAWEVWEAARGEADDPMP